MAKRNEYVDYLLELMKDLGHVTARPMFGGFGIYCDGLFFAIVVDDVLYFKADDTNRGQFLERELLPFTYEMKGETMTMNYYRCPEEALESPAPMQEWARSGIGAALRAQAGRRPKTPRSLKIKAKVKAKAKKPVAPRPKRKKPAPA